jgi:hypothetical protein
MYRQRGYEQLGTSIAAIMGIIFNAGGTVMMVRYGLPYSLPILGLLLKRLTEEEVNESDRRHLRGAMGLILLVFGSALQIVAVALK